MFHRYFSCKQMMMALLLFALTCGCAGNAVVAARKPPPISYSEMSCRAQELGYRIVGTAQIDLLLPQGHYPFRAALILQKPAYLRLEVLPLIGTPDFILSATPDEMRVYIPAQDEFYQGKPSVENLRRFFPWPLTIEEMVMILSGAFPCLSKENVLYGSFPEDDGLRIEMTAPSGDLQIIWMDKYNRLSHFSRRSPAGKEIYQVRYENYSADNSLAGSVTIKMADQITTLTVQFTEMTLEKTVDPSVFELPVVVAAKLIQLDGRQ